MRPDRLEKVVEHFSKTTSGNTSSAQPQTYGRKHPHQLKGPSRHSKAVAQYSRWVEINYKSINYNDELTIYEPRCQRELNTYKNFHF